MIGPLKVTVHNAHIPNLSEVNKVYWTYRFEIYELEGLGYFCPRCGNSRMIKPPDPNVVEGMLAWD